jgi:predicted RNase H-like nuclease (RuvC/YqgF family)
MSFTVRQNMISYPNCEICLKRECAYHSYEHFQVCSKCYKEFKEESKEETKIETMQKENEKLKKEVDEYKEIIEKLNKKLRFIQKVCEKA